jgi:hypothetical protein
MVSVSLAEAVVQQTLIIEEARRHMLLAENDKTLHFWADVLLKAVAAIDGMCLKRMELTTYEMLRRQQLALLANLSLPEPRSAGV